MTFFSEYIKSIITVGICAFLSESVCTYFSKNKNSTKAVKFITNLCVFVVAVSPLFSLFTGVDFENIVIQNESTVTNSDETFISLTEKETEKSVSQEIFENTGILARNVSIQIVCSDNTLTVSSIDVIVNDESEIQTVKDYITKSFGKYPKTKITVKTNEQN